MAWTLNTIHDDDGGKLYRLLYLLLLLAKVMNFSVSLFSKLHKTALLLPIYPLDLSAPCAIYLPDSFAFLGQRILSNYVSLLSGFVFHFTSLQSLSSMESWRLLSHQSRPRRCWVYWKMKPQWMLVTRRVEIKFQPSPKIKQPHPIIVTRRLLAELYGTRGAFGAKNINSSVRGWAAWGIVRSFSAREIYF